MISETKKLIRLIDIFILLDDLDFNLFDNSYF